MFLTLLFVTFLVATIVCLVVARIFSKPIEQILSRIIASQISAAWHRYLLFALYVAGISAGVRIWELEKYISPPPHAEHAQALTLTRDRWVLELYRTIIETLQGIAWVLLLFFIVALLAFAVVRILEMRMSSKNDPKPV